MHSEVYSVPVSGPKAAGGWQGREKAQEGRQGGSSDLQLGEPGPRPRHPRSAGAEAVQGVCSQGPLLLSALTWAAAVGSNSTRSCPTASPGLALQPVSCGGVLGGEGGIAHATVVGIMATSLHTRYTGPFSQRRVSAVCRAHRALESPSPPCRKVPSYRASLCPPPHPSITPVCPSGRSWYRVASLEESGRGTRAKASASPAPSSSQPWRPCHCW